MKKFYVLLSFALMVLGLQAQDITITTQRLENNPELGLKFRKCEEYHVDIASVQAALQQINKPVIKFELALSDRKVTMDFIEYNLIKPTARLRTNLHPNSPSEVINPSIRTFRGNVLDANGGFASMTIADQYILIVYQIGKDVFYLEPTVIGGQTNLDGNLMLYKTSDVIISEGFKCASEQSSQFKKENVPTQNVDIASRNGTCFELSISLACDFRFVNQQGGVPGAQASMIAYLNLVLTDWETIDLGSDYYFILSDMFVPMDIASDPFSASTDFNSMLSTFQSVAPTIFTGPFNVATAWTNRFAGLGEAFLASVCMASPFNVSSSFYGAAAIARNSQSHNLGHNFSAGHSSGGYIMDAGPTGSIDWESNSERAIATYAFLQAGCLSECKSVNPLPDIKFMAKPDSFGCVPLTVQFKNLTTGGTMYKWEFPGGTPATSTDVDPIVVYTKAGNYDVTLEAKNPRCSSKLTVLQYIHANDVPDPNFIYGDPFRDCVFEFFDQSLRGEVWRWNFGDGSPIEEGEYVTHEYTKEGFYDVTLTVTNACGTKSIVKKIRCAKVPTADFTADTTWGCASKTIHFKDLSSSNVLNWTWSFPGGTPNGSSVKNPIVTYTQPGVYKVKLTVNGSVYNATETKEMYITIDSLPIADFLANINGFDVDFTNQSTNALSHSWNFGDGSSLSSEANPKHTYKDGIYDVTYTATNACGNTVIKKSITIVIRPIASFKTKTQTGCVPFTVNFENTSTITATDFIWTFPGGTPSTSTDKNPVVVYNTVGKFDVKLVAKNSLSADSLTSTEFIKVEDKPISDFQNNVTGFVCFFTDKSIKASKYYWEFGDGKTSTLPSPSHNYGVEGEFVVKLITENFCGFDTLERRVAIYLIPKVNFTSDVFKGCAPFNVNFQNTSSIDVNDWDWQFEGGTPNVSKDANPSVTFKKQGKYTVKLTVKNNNGTNSTTKIKYIEVVSPVLCPDRPNKKKLKIPNNGFSSEEDQLLNRIDDAESTIIFPNPTDHIINIMGSGLQSYELVDFSGKQICTGLLAEGLNAVDVKNIDAGVYLLKIVSQNERTATKVIIAK